MLPNAENYKHDDDKASDTEPTGTFCVSYEIDSVQ